MRLSQNEKKRITAPRALEEVKFVRGDALSIFFNKSMEKSKKKLNKGPKAVKVQGQTIDMAAEFVIP